MRNVGLDLRNVLLGLAILLACASAACAGTKPAVLRNITVAYDCGGCDTAYAIALGPTDAFTLTRASTGERTSGSVNYARFASALLRTSFFTRLGSAKWMTLSTGTGSGAFVIAAYGCTTPTCAYGTGALYRVSFEPALAPDLAAYVQSVYAAAEPEMARQEDALRRRLVDVAALRSVDIVEQPFQRCRSLHAIFTAGNTLAGTYVSPSGATGRFEAQLLFTFISRLLARAHPERFARMYGQSTPLTLRLTLRYRSFKYGVWAPSATVAPPALVSFMGALDEELRHATDAQCG